MSPVGHSAALLTEKTLRSKSTITPRTTGEVESLRKKSQHIYFFLTLCNVICARFFSLARSPNSVVALFEKLMLEHAVYADRKNIQQELWRRVFYAEIEKFRLTIHKVFVNLIYMNTRSAAFLFDSFFWRFAFLKFKSSSSKAAAPSDSEKRKEVINRYLVYLNQAATYHVTLYRKMEIVELERNRKRELDFRFSASHCRRSCVERHELLEELLSDLAWRHRYDMCQSIMWKVPMFPFLVRYHREAGWFVDESPMRP
jgi:hypothetical protein